MTNLSNSARRHAIFAGVRSVLIWAALIAPWFLNEQGELSVSWPVAVFFAGVLPAITMVTLPLGRIANKMVRHLNPKPAPMQFENVATEISIALQEPVERILTHRCEIANVAMLPAQTGEVVVATEGALARLNRHELQALVAAQFAGMRDPWCRMATRAEIMWWAIPWVFPLCIFGFMSGRPAGGVASFLSVFVWAFVPRWNEQARDLCADVAAVRTTLDPQSLAGAMRKLSEEAGKTSKVDLGAWYLPINPFLVLPRRADSTTTVSVNGSSRSWTTKDEVRMELLLRADRAEAMANGADPEKFTGKAFQERWSQLGRDQ